MIKRHIPNAITSLNLLSGCLAIILTLVAYRPDLGAWLIILAAVFDFFDGLVARSLGVSSPIGKDLDSLADVVSFGFAPSVLLFWGLWLSTADFIYALIPLILVIAAALRLAKFNNDSRQTNSFIGLPVPANALFWLGWQALLPELNLLLGFRLLLVCTYTLVLVFSFLMLCELPMFSFKLKKGIGFKALLPQVTLLVISALAFFFWGLVGGSVAVVAYILLSVFVAIRPNIE